MSKAKLITAMFFFVLIISILLTGCKGSENQNGETDSTSEQAIQNTQEQTDAQPVTAKNDVHVVEMFKKSGSYTPNEFDMPWEYRYSIPRLEDDSTDAKRINDNIKEIYLALAEEQLQLIEKNEWANSLRVDYSMERSERTISIILRADNGLSFTEYGVYCYDIQSQKWLDNADLLNMFNFSEKEYIDRVVMAAEKCFVEQNSEIPENEREDYGYYEAYDYIPQLITLDSTMPYIAADDGLKVIAPVASIAGNDWYYLTLDIPLDAVG